MKHILIVDDNKTNLSSGKSALNDTYKVTAVTSGAQELKFLEKNLCDIILLDINMPEMDGFEVMKRIRENSELADVFDALVSKRCYKEAFSYDKAFQIIEESLGSHFDPELGRIFITCRPELEELYDSIQQ